MHVAFLNDSAPTGDADARLVGLVESLSRAGHKASLVLGAGTPPDDLSRLVEKRVLVVPMAASMSAGAALGAAESVARFCETEFVDILHLFSGISLLIGSVAAARLKRPYVAAVDAPIAAPSDGDTASWLLLEHTLGGARRVFCSRSDVRRLVLLAAPGAECRPFPIATAAGSNGATETWDIYLSESLRRDGQPLLLDVPQRLKRLFDQYPQLSICSNEMTRALLRELQSETAAASDRLAHLTQARAFESDKHKQTLNRQRQRLEATENRLGEAVSELESAQAAVERLTTDLGEREQVLLTSHVNAADPEQELREIKTSTGWALLQILWSWRQKLVPHSSRRDRALWVVLSTYRAVRQGGPAGLALACLRSMASSTAASYLIDGVPLPVRTWIQSATGTSTTIRWRPWRSASRSSSQTGLKVRVHGSHPGRKRRNTT
jgi:hypothetical protein